MSWFKKESKPVEKEPIEELVQEQEKTEEPQIEMFDVKASGKYSVDVVEREERYSHQHPYGVFFRYNFDVEFLGYKIKSKGTISFEPTRDERMGRHFYVCASPTSEEYAYEYAIKLLSEGEDEIMSSFRVRIAEDVRKYIQEKRIDELKNIIKGKNSFEVDLSFKMEKPKK